MSNTLEEKLYEIRSLMCLYAQEDNWHSNRVMGYKCHAIAKDFGRNGRRVLTLIDELIKEINKKEKRPADIVDKEKGRT